MLHVITYIAAMDTWNAILTGIQQIAQQLAEGGANGAAILSSLVSQMVAMATATAGMAQAYEARFGSVESRIGRMEDSCRKR